MNSAGRPEPGCILTVAIEYSFSKFKVWIQHFFSRALMTSYESGQIRGILTGTDTAGDALSKTSGLFAKTAGMICENRELYFYLRCCSRN